MGTYILSSCMFRFRLLSFRFLICPPDRYRNVSLRKPTKRVQDESVEISNLAKGYDRHEVRNLAGC